MVAQTYSTALLSQGIRELSMVTNTWGGYMQSAGGAETLYFPFEPDMFEWWNYTHFATGGGGTNAQGVWLRDMPAGDSLIISIAPVTVLETTNGVTVANTASAYTDQHVTITGITTANPAVVTAASHGLANGDRAIITKVVGTMDIEVNNKEFVAGNVALNTFELFDHFGNTVNVAGAYTSGGQVTKVGPKYGITMSAPVWGLTLMTAIMGANDDIIYFVATKFNSYFNLGDLA